MQLACRRRYPPRARAISRRCPRSCLLYLACLATAETVSMMGEDLVRDHLVETLEMHLGTRLLNGYYPRVGLAAGQRSASKGGFLVRFAGPDGTRLVADGD